MTSRACISLQLVGIVISNLTGTCWESHALSEPSKSQGELIYALEFALIEANELREVPLFADITPTLRLWRPKF